MEGQAELEMTSYDLRGGHAGLDQLMRRAIRDRILLENA
jgi:hypothetical protein